MVLFQTHAARCFLRLLAFILSRFTSVRRSALMAYEHLTPFQAGYINALGHQWYSCTEISAACHEHHGWCISKSKVQRVLAHFEQDPSWTGERREGSGAKRATTPAQDEAIVKFVLGNRGLCRVTSRTVAKTILKRKVTKQCFLRLFRAFYWFCFFLRTSARIGWREQCTLSHGMLLFLARLECKGDRWIGMGDPPCLFQSPNAPVWPS
jgi:hypothetical protein